MTSQQLYQAYMQKMRQYQVYRSFVGGDMSNSQPVSTKVKIRILLDESAIAGQPPEMNNIVKVDGEIVKNGDVKECEITPEGILFSAYPDRNAGSIKFMRFSFEPDGTDHDCRDMNEGFSINYVFTEDSDVTAYFGTFED